MGGNVNNLSGKQLQASAEARVVSLSQFEEGNEEENQTVGCLPDYVDSPNFLNR